MPASLGRKNLASLVADFERHASRIAVVAPQGVRQIKTTYGDLARLSQRFAAELRNRGIQKGDRVLLWGENSAEWVAAFFGCVLRGVLPVPLDAAGGDDFAARVITEVSPRLILVGSSQVAGSSQGLVAGSSQQAHRFPIPTLPFETLAESLPQETAGAIEDLSLDDPLQIIFTSGTTADPKGIVHTHGNVLASLLPIESEMQKYLKYERPFRPIRFLHTLPLSHVFGQFMGLWIPPLLAAEVHYQARLVASELAEQIRRERISVLAAVPRILHLLQEHLQDRFAGLPARIEAAQGWNAWQRWWHFRDVHRFLGFKFWAFVCGGAALSPASEQFWNALGWAVVQGYGMTETTALVSLNHPFRPSRGTIGQVLPGREVRLSEAGEVLVRGDTISDTVWQGGRALRLPDEWLRTGDLADFDAAGNLRFRGRIKDVIVTAAGLNIHPEDLEAALTRQAGIKAAAVIETDAGHGPEPLAVLVLLSDTDAGRAVEAANRELAAFQQIHHSIVWPEPDLPRTSTGKILRREVARQVASGGASALRPEGDASTELNLDSLGRVELQAKLEQQCGITLSDAAVQGIRTSSDIQQLLKTAPAATDGARPDGHIYPRWPWRPVQQAIRSLFLEVVAMPLVRLLGKPSATNDVRTWPAGPLLIVANHITSYDAAFVLYALPRRVRHRVAIAMSGEMLLDMRRGRNQGNWFLNLLGPPAYFLITALFNVFPLPQRTGFRRSFRHAGDAIDHGLSVLVFPEGRRSDDGTPQTFQAGAGLLWRDLGVPALPVYLAGLGDLKSQGGRWFRSGKIKVTVGQVLPLERNRSPEQLVGELREGVLGPLSENQAADANRMRDRFH